MSDLLTLWPPEASAHAVEVDALLGLFVALVVLLSAPVFILTAIFAIRYRRRREENRVHARNRNIWLEVSWAIIPFVLIVGFYVWSTQMFLDLRHAPPDAMEIHVIAKQWMWKLQHAGGQGEINELHVPVDQPVKLVMTSQDVIHSFFVPALRLKQDVLPDRYTTLWFQADRPGIYRLACAEFCGTNHSEMGGRVVVMRQPEFQRWLETAAVDATLAQKGARLFHEVGCSGCHGPAATVHAPSLEGLYGKPVPLENGDVVIADEQYIRDSILLPQSQIAAGYPHIMPTFRNVLGEDDVVALVAYVESLGTGPGKEGP